MITPPIVFFSNLTNKYYHIILYGKKNKAPVRKILPAGDILSFVGDAHLLQSDFSLQPTNH